ncbi:hypothetical protein HYQ46_012904 [Verticillium longisporum]|nr:hypothetical protein HYQ46_012904 [Verticillium longisporum]
MMRMKKRPLLHDSVTFSPVEHSAFALVLDIVAGDTLRVGILELAKLIDRDTFESAEAFRGHFDPAQFAATRRRMPMSGIGRDASNDLPGTDAVQAIKECRRSFTHL